MLDEADETIEGLRKDFAHETEATPAKRGRGRPRKTAAAMRKDSPAFSTPIDGYGDPFRVRMAAGWTYKWATEDMRARYQMWSWEMGIWGDPRILNCTGLLDPRSRADERAPITYRGYTLMILTEENARRIKAADPMRQASVLRRKAIMRRATEGLPIAVPGEEPPPGDSAVDQYGRRIRGGVEVQTIHLNVES